MPISATKRKLKRYLMIPLSILIGAAVPRKKSTFKKNRCSDLKCLILQDGTISILKKFDHVIEFISKHKELMDIITENFLPGMIVVIVVCKKTSDIEYG